MPSLSPENIKEWVNDFLQLYREIAVEKFPNKKYQLKFYREKFLSIDISMTRDFEYCVIIFCRGKHEQQSDEIKFFHDYDDPNTLEVNIEWRTTNYQLKDEYLGILRFSRREFEAIPSVLQYIEKYISDELNRALIPFFKILPVENEIQIPKNSKIFISCGQRESEQVIGDWLFNKLVKDNLNKENDIFWWPKKYTGKPSVEIIKKKLKGSTHLIGFLHPREKIEKSNNWTVSTFSRDEIISAGALSWVQKNKRIIVFLTPEIKMEGSGMLGDVADVRPPISNTQELTDILVEFFRKSELTLIGDEERLTFKAIYRELTENIKVLNSIEIIFAKPKIKTLKILEHTGKIQALDPRLRNKFTKIIESVERIIPICDKGQYLIGYTSNGPVEESVIKEKIQLENEMVKQKTQLTKLIRETQELLSKNI